MTNLSEPLPELFNQSKVVVLDFAQITSDTPVEANIKLFFEESISNGQNPRLPENRQRFNNQLIETSGCRYLIGRYAEDRIAMLADTPSGKQGRTIHTALDIFAKTLEPVHAPSDGEIVTSGYEEGFGEYGNYLLFKPKDEDYYLFFGHLSSDHMGTGLVRRDQLLAHLGDYHDNENGGWSRHLHIQVLTKLPASGVIPPGYSSRGDFEANSKLFPNPMGYFSGWQLK